MDTTAVADPLPMTFFVGISSLLDHTAATPQFELDNFTPTDQSTPF